MSLNRYFQDELSYLRDLGAAFARENPRLAPYLARESSDPDVERLLEGFAFLTGRLREKLDDEIPEFSHSLIELLWPNYLRPVPSMTVIEFSPLPGADASQPIRKGTVVASRPIGSTSCQFQTGYEVRCVPFRVSGADVESTPNSTKLTLKLQVADGANLALFEQDSIRLFLDGGHETSTVRALYRSMLRHLKQIEFVGAGGTSFQIGPDSVAPVGFESDQGVLPYPPGAFPGFRLLQEYFAFPEKFMFLDLLNVGRIRELRGEEIEVRFNFSRPLERGATVTRETFRLNCTPAVNVFKSDGEPINLDRRRSEYRVRPLGSRDQSLDVYSVDRVIGWLRGRGRGARVDYQPFDSFRPILGGKSETVYFRIRRRSAISKASVDTYISFVDSESRETRLQAETVSVELTCTNGRAAEALPIGAVDQPTSTSPSFASFRNATAVTPQIPPPLDRNLLWILISNLALNYSSLADRHALGVLLTTFNIRSHVDEQENRRMELMLEAIQSVQTEEMDWMRGGMPLRGTRFDLALVESKLGGDAEMFLFGSVLDRFLDMFSNINAVHQLVVRGVERNVRYEWAVRTGQKRTL